jgi:hypothetical protein
MRVLLSVFAVVASVSGALAGGFTDGYLGLPPHYGCLVWGDCPPDEYPGYYPGYRGGSGTGSNPEGHCVRGYYRRNGTWVAPHYQSNPRSTTTGQGEREPLYRAAGNAHSAVLTLRRPTPTAARIRVKKLLTTLATASAACITC